MPYDLSSLMSNSRNTNSGGNTAIPWRFSSIPPEDRQPGATGPGGGSGFGQTGGNTFGAGQVPPSYSGHGGQGTGGGMGFGFKGEKKQLKQAGFQSLFDMLQNNGRTDPAQMNLLFNNIDYGVQANQQGTTGQLAGAGLEGSGLGQALLGAEGQAGVQTKANAQAEDNQRAYERQLQNLALLYQMIIGPGVARRGQDRALQAALASRQRNGFDFGGLLSGIGSIGKLFGLGAPAPSTGRDGYGTNDPTGSFSGGANDPNGNIS